MDLNPTHKRKKGEPLRRFSDLSGEHVERLVAITVRHMERQERIELDNTSWKNDVRKYCDLHSVSYPAALVRLLADANVNAGNAEKG